VIDRVLTIAEPKLAYSSSVKPGLAKNLKTAAAIPRTTKIIAAKVPRLTSYSDGMLFVKKYAAMPAMAIVGKTTGRVALTAAALNPPPRAATTVFATADRPKSFLTIVFSSFARPMLSSFIEERRQSPDKSPDHPTRPAP
jgi:hypothetical protein